MDVFYTLVKKVARAYYAPKYIVVLDLLSSIGITSLKEEEIASRVKLSTKEIQKICGKLKDDRLIKSEPKQEPRRDGRMGTKQYHYIDYKLFVDTVKWKIHQMTKKINEKRENELQNKGYKCPSCGTKYSALDVLTLIDPVTNLFMCEYCNVELTQEINDESNNVGQEQYSRLMLQCGPIVDLLKMTDNLVFPDYTPSSSGNTIVAEKTNLSNQRDLRIAEDSENITGEIVIEFQDKDDILLRKQQEEESKLKRKQNELPAWYQFSTVTGERVAPGNEKIETENDETETEKRKDNFLIEENLDTGYLNDYYDNLEKSNVEFILTPMSDGSSESSDTSENESEEFIEVKIKDEKSDEGDKVENNSNGNNKRLLDSSTEDNDEDDDDDDDEEEDYNDNNRSKRKRINMESVQTPMSMSEDNSSEYNNSDDVT